MLKKQALSRSRELTLPDERYRAVMYAADFMQRLAGGEFPRVPKAVREEARSILRHFPTRWELDELERFAPHVVQKNMEQLHRWLAQHNPEVSQPLEQRE